MATAKKQQKRSWLIWLIPLLIIVGVFWTTSALYSPTTIDTSEGLALLDGKTVKRAVVNDGTQQVVLDLDKKYTPKKRSEDKSVLPKQPSDKVTFTFTRAQSEQLDKLVQQGKFKDGFDSVYPTTSWWSTVIQMVLLFGVFFFILFFFTSKMQGGMKFMNFGKSKIADSEDAPNVTFDDVAGEDEAVEELQEIKEFLEIPQKFHALGAKIPKGVLLYGPPGTGKTLLAKAVAGEAGVPFYSMSGSEFVEMFVGVGASRVRDLFTQAKDHAPSIIFVDEIDAVGRNRGSGVGGGNDEREQTLNQLLVEMDGFDENTNVIMIAATNRPDVLDPALLRPGRFDRQIAVEAPDLKGREAILKVHAKGKPMTKDVDLAAVAKRTPGFTGADLANVLNEAALLTARSNADLIDIRALDEAIDRVIAGPQKRTRVMNAHDKAVTAYHEGGHAMCAAALRYTDPVTKVTILPRGRALGYTMVMPTEDRYNKTRNQLLDELVYAMGGRVAEELVFLDPSTGASNDIEKATGIARKLVSDYGMSSSIGPVKLGHDDTQPFLGKEGISSRDFSEDTAAIIDTEVHKLMDNAMREAWEILSRNREVLDTLARRLMEEETLLEPALDKIFADVIKQPERKRWFYGAEYAVDKSAFGDPIMEPVADSKEDEEQLKQPPTAPVEEPTPVGSSKADIDRKLKQPPPPTSRRRPSRAPTEKPDSDNQPADAAPQIIPPKPKKTTPSHHHSDNDSQATIIDQVQRQAPPVVPPRPTSSDATFSEGMPGAGMPGAGMSSSSSDTPVRSAHDAPAGDRASSLKTPSGATDQATSKATPSGSGAAPSESGAAQSEPQATPSESKAARPTPGTAPSTPSTDGGHYRPPYAPQHLFGLGAGAKRLHDPADEPKEDTDKDEEHSSHDNSSTAWTPDEPRIWDTGPDNDRH